MGEWGEARCGWALLGLAASSLEGLRALHAALQFLLRCFHLIYDGIPGWGSNLEVHGGNWKHEKQ